MNERKVIFKRSVLLIMALSIVFGILGATMLGAYASEEPVSSFDDGYELGADWIWADTAVAVGQWVAMRKTFSLQTVPSELIARISADTKYWLWINGEQVVFEGQLKMGDSRYTWYYDKVDIASYLTAGENTIAVQVFYSGKASGSTLNTRVPSFLFDAKAEGISIFSDTSWRAILDPAYEEPISLNNDRNGEANIKYNASKEMIDASGNRWTDKDYDDSAWGYAVDQSEKIRTNIIYDDENKLVQNVDPRRMLVLRSIPQLKVGEITKFTSDGRDGTGKWIMSGDGTAFAPLSLPSTYTVEAEVVVKDAIQYIAGKPTGGAIGICVCVSDADNLYMPQIGFNQGSWNGVRFKPHTRVNGAWKSTTTDFTSTELGKSLYLSGSYDYRYNTKHTVKIEVTETAINTYLNGTLLGTVNDTQLKREGSTIGFRQDINELIHLYSLKVTDATGKEIYDAGIESLDAGDTVSRFSMLVQENASYTSPYNAVEKDTSGESYVAIRNCRSAVNGRTFVSTYKIENRSNIQGTPYIKVRSEKGGEIISMVSDAWAKGNASSIAHQYITKPGEQTWEALGWMNGYIITFTAPESVEVIELGFRESGYDTEETGSMITDSEIINQLYREAYDTLYVCMRDSYMDCPDRERTQWWGDAVINMQQAAYAMDDRAALLYAKTLTQAIGFVKDGGELPSKLALGRPDLELPMQSLAGVHSFWQYYMYYGDDTLLLESYPVLLNYLKLWDISESGVITHRDGNWNWYDWGSHADTVIIENCWYYVALESVLNIARLDGCSATEEDIAFLEGRMELIAKNFDTLYWDYSKNAYYNNTDNAIPDDRANAMAVYAGLADISRYYGILEVLNSTYNSGPYGEKYVLDAMYMMGADDEAMARTLSRFTPFTTDGYPTLPEIWLDQTLYNGDESKNHAWTGSPLSMLYMYNAGITSVAPGFSSIQIRPQLGSLNSISASVKRAVGRIAVSVVKNSDGYSMVVTVPDGVKSALIYVPRIAGVDTAVMLGDFLVYANGRALTANMPLGVSYVGEDTDFIGFSVPAGTYSFESDENIAADSDSYEVIFGVSGNGSVKVNGAAVNDPVKVAKGGSITVTATPEEGYRLVAIIGSFAESIVSDTSIEKTYTVNSDMSLQFVFEKIPVDNRLLSITAQNTEVATYAVSVYVNGNLVSLPYNGSYPTGSVVTVTAVPSGNSNYDVKINGASAEEYVVTMSENADLVLDVAVKECVTKIPISSVTPSDKTNNNNWKPEYLKDGIIISNTALGYTTGWKSTNDFSANPHTIVFDLGTIQTINQVSMFPRFDSSAADSSLSCNYPVDFTISVSEDGSTYNTVVTVTGCENPRFKQQCYSFAATSARYVKLTVTKLGIPAYDDGSNNDHYRLQLSEFEVYYNSGIAHEETEYGTIPFEYIDSEVYPIVIFKKDKTFIGAFNSWKNALDCVGYVEKTANTGKGVDSVILFRRDYVHNVGTGNLHSFYNNIIIDLGGNTITLEKQNFLGLYIYNSGTTEREFGSITVKNGKFINKAKNTAPVCLDGGANVTESITYNVAFENVRFTVINSTDVLYGAIRTWTSKGTASLKLNATLTDCIFDYTGANTNAGMLYLSDLGDTKSIFNISINGGEIIAGTNSSFNFITKTAEDKVVFDRNEDGEYTTLKLTGGAQAPSDSIVYNTADNCECAFVYSSSDDGNDVYTLYPKVMLGFKIKSSVSLWSNLVYNVYIPTANVKGFTVNGNEPEYTTVTMDEVEYYLVSVPLAAGDSLSDIEVRVTLNAGSTDVSAKWTLSVLSYVSRVLGDGCDSVTEALMKDMLSYARAAHIFFGRTDGIEAKLSAIDAILGADYDVNNKVIIPENSAKKPEDDT
ncbi:MAG: hypothetical protein E7617_08295, partial [Ruminococcaceae bacterium]|nr:hypothetical protein [Oscillospiraceae bacterium]